MIFGLISHYWVTFPFNQCPKMGNYHNLIASHGTQIKNRIFTWIIYYYRKFNFCIHYFYYFFILYHPKFNAIIMCNEFYFYKCLCVENLIWSTWNKYSMFEFDIKSFILVTPVEESNGAKELDKDSSDPLRNVSRRIFLYYKLKSLHGWSQKWHL